MSYNDGVATNDYYRQFSGGTYSVTPMLYDIQAMQFLYGANTAYKTGDTTYAFTNFSAPQAIWDGGGINTFDFSACTGATIQNAIAGAGGSTIYCNSAADVITGGTGNDTIWLRTGTATIDGKGGTNMVELTGASNLAADSFTNSQTYTVTGDHHLIFNNAKIDSSTTNYDIDFILKGSDAQVASLYNAALGRLPDLIGLEYYAVPVAQGTLSRHQAAENFLASPEFQSHFPAAAQPADDGGVNDQAFIVQLYQNVLHRTPVASEISYYVADLQGTLPGQDRAQLRLDFATSPENLKDISGWLI